MIPDEPTILPFPADRPRDVIPFPTPATASKTLAFGANPLVDALVVMDLRDQIQAAFYPGVTVTVDPPNPPAPDADDEPEDTPLYVPGESARPDLHPADVYGTYDGA